MSLIINNGSEGGNGGGSGEGEITRLAGFSNSTASVEVTTSPVFNKNIDNKSFGGLIYYISDTYSPNSFYASSDSNKLYSFPNVYNYGNRYNFVEYNGWLINLSYQFTIQSNSSPCQIKCVLDNASWATNLETGESIQLTADNPVYVNVSPIYRVDTTYGTLASPSNTPGGTLATAGVVPYNNKIYSVCIRYLRTGNSVGNYALQPVIFTVESSIDFETGKVTFSVKYKTSSSTDYCLTDMRHQTELDAYSYFKDGFLYGYNIYGTAVSPGSFDSGKGLYYKIKMDATTINDEWYSVNITSPMLIWVPIGGGYKFVDYDWLFYPSTTTSALGKVYVVDRLTNRFHLVSPQGFDNRDTFSYTTAGKEVIQQNERELCNEHITNQVSSGEERVWVGQIQNIFRINDNETVFSELSTNGSTLYVKYLYHVVNKIKVKLNLHEAL